MSGFTAGGGGRTTGSGSTTVVEGFFDRSGTEGSSGVGSMLSIVGESIFAGAGAGGSGFRLRSICGMTDSGSGRTTTAGGSMGISTGSTLSSG